MSLPTKIGLVVAGVAGISGAGYLGSKFIKTESKETFRTKYSKAIIDTTKYEDTWGKKLTALAETNSSPKHSKLIRAKQEKTANSGADTSLLKQACEDIYSKEIGNDNDLQDFKNFCSFNNEDKIASGKELIKNKADFSSYWDEFKSSNKESLYRGFKSVFEQKGSNATEKDWQQKMLDECKNIASDIFSEEISNFTSFCTKSSTQASSG
ncbi:hypothetical protein MHC_01395 [Mycoplasma haemocanis str. Illinois]|uniref:Uncharacterized protein n=1 Tax=Mycoplasma haemocanis (strain Illinois) TaxID=1111676 RepID=H6N673_MYCHN|nr:hypothetical protein [Mycoplasma haemocanis]AEW45145.1 hypothetical protein MHC_01395 [Mycoplasma haemocanis str. Illinois]